MAAQKKADGGITRVISGSLYPAERITKLSRFKKSYGQNLQILPLSDCLQSAIQAVVTVFISRPNKARISPLTLHVLSNRKDRRMNLELVAQETLQSVDMVDSILEALPLLGIQCVNESDLIGFLANEEQMEWDVGGPNFFWGGQA